MVIVFARVSAASRLQHCALTHLILSRLPDLGRSVANNKATSQTSAAGAAGTWQRFRFWCWRQRCRASAGRGIGRRTRHEQADLPAEMGGSSGGELDARQSGHYL